MKILFHFPLFIIIPFNIIIIVVNKDRMKNINILNHKNIYIYIPLHSTQFQTFEPTKQDMLKD